MEYIKNESDVDLICNAIAHEMKSEDSFFDDSAETLLKAIVYYVIDKVGETKTLARCKEIVELGLEGRERVRELFETLGEEESARLLYTSIDISTDRTYKEIFETLNQKLNRILN